MPVEVERRLARLEGVGQAVRLGRNLHIHPEPLAELEARVIAICERDGNATIASVRDELARRASTPRRCWSTWTARGSRGGTGTLMCCGAAVSAPTAAGPGNR